MIDSVIFDMDGLMFDTEALGVKIWKDAAVKYNCPEINSLIYKCIGTNYDFQEKLFADVIGKDFPFKEFHEFIWKERDVYLDKYGVPIKKGLFELLDFLKEKGLKTAVATSTKKSSAQKILENAGVLKYFDCIVTGNEIEHGKPEPDIFLLACSRLGAKEENSLGLEDSFNGIRALHRAGIKSVMIPDLIQPDDEISKLYFRRANDLTEVISIISEENSWNTQK